MHEREAGKPPYDMMIFANSPVYYDKPALEKAMLLPLHVTCDAIKEITLACVKWSLTALQTCGIIWPRQPDQCQPAAS